MPLIGINLQLIWFTSLYKGVNQLAGVVKMYILVYETVYDQQAILLVGELVHVCQNRSGHVTVRIVLRQIHVTFGITGIVKVPRGDRGAGDSQLRISRRS